MLNEALNNLFPERSYTHLDVLNFYSFRAVLAKYDPGTGSRQQNAIIDNVVTV